MKAVMDERMGVARRNISSTEIRHQPGVKGGSQIVTHNPELKLVLTFRLSRNRGFQLSSS